MSIPLDPALIAGAVIFQPPLVATSLNTCKPPKEGLKSISMQMKPSSSNPSFSVDLGQGAPNLSISQLCSIFIDATGCNGEISVYFPDTGYIATCPPGTSKLVPVFTGLQVPKFYVIDNAPPLLGNDVVNIICLNQFIPEFIGAVETVLVLNETIGKKNVPKLLGRQSFVQPFIDTFNLFGVTGSGSVTVVPDPILGLSNACQQLFITEIDISCTAQTTDGSTQTGNVTLVDLNNPTYTVNGRTYGSSSFIGGGQFILTPTLARHNIIKLSNLDYISSEFANPNSELIQMLFGGVTNKIAITWSINIFGGILA